MTEFFATINTYIDLIVLLGGAAVFAYLMVYWHLDKKTRFDVRDLIIDSATKELSLYKVGQLVALIISTWILIYETRAGKLTEWLFGSYMIAWSGANLIKKYLEKPESKNTK
jgi:hypothetical protein